MKNVVGDIMKHQRSIITLFLCFAVCACSPETGHVFIDSDGSEGAKDAGKSELLAKLDQWQKVPVGIYRFESKCNLPDAENAEISIPVNENDLWVIQFVPCGVKTLKNEQIPEDIRANVT